MKPIFSCLKQAAATLAVVALSFSASADPVESTSRVLSRNQASGLTVQGSLSKNIYRQESVQVPYPVQVPYQEQEAYTDYESYIDQEYRCTNTTENQCGYEQECHMVGGGQQCFPQQVCNQVGGGQQCHQQQVCSNRPGNPGSCQNVTECGTNAQGQQICKTRQVCNGGGGGGQECHMENRCDNAPPRQECHTENRCTNAPPRQECSNQYRCHSVPRQQCGYENVTKTRPVTRYRTVTKYRTEMQCCKTEVRNVFDHQETLDVVLQFPAGSELMAGEVESFRISMVGEASRPDVDMQVVSGMSNYRIANKIIQGHLATLTLEAAPMVINPVEVGEASVTNVRLKIMEDGTGVVVLTDAGQKGRLVTTYDIFVRDGSGQLLVTQQAGYQAPADQRIVLNRRLSLNTDNDLELRITRSGQGLVQPVTFVKRFHRPH